MGELAPQPRVSRFGEDLLALRVDQAFAKEVAIIAKKVVVLHEFGYEHVERGGTSGISESRRAWSRRGRRRRSAGAGR